MIRKIFLAVAACMLLGIIGCETVPTIVYDNSTPKVTTSAAFNQETFVWEYFLFPTNRVSGTK